MKLALAYASSPFHVIQRHGLPEIAGRAIAMISLIDLVFWFVSVWFAVFLVQRPLSREERLAIGTYELGR